MAGKTPLEAIREVLSRLNKSEGDYQFKWETAARAIPNFRSRCIVEAKGDDRIVSYRDTKSRCTFHLLQKTWSPFPWESRFSAWSRRIGGLKSWAD